MYLASWRVCNKVLLCLEINYFTRCVVFYFYFNNMIEYVTRWRLINIATYRKLDKIHTQERGWYDDPFQVMQNMTIK